MQSVRACAFETRFSISCRFVRTSLKSLISGSILATFFIGLALSCAQPPKTKYRKAFKPYVGMPASEVKDLLGPPDADFVSRFGQETKKGEWQGRVWLYFGDRDSRYHHVDRRLKDTLVFYPPDGDMHLNHWKFELPEEPSGEQSRDEP